MPSSCIFLSTHCFEVGEHTAEPAGIDIVHTDAGSFFLDGICCLFFCADKKNRLIILRKLSDKVISLFQFFHGLLEIYDINTISLTIDVLCHLGVPAAGLVTKVDTGLQQLLHGYDCHFLFLLYNMFFLRGHHTFSQAAIHGHMGRKSAPRAKCSDIIPEE